MQQFAIYPLVLRVQIFDSLKDIPLNSSRAYKAEIMYIFKDKIERHFSGMPVRNQ